TNIFKLQVDYQRLINFDKNFFGFFLGLQHRRDARPCVSIDINSKIPQIKFIEPTIYEILCELYIFVMLFQRTNYSIFGEIGSPDC
ncbi:MAG: hypothetical protein IK017_07585, partial [Paludibacteraceae bacterium]|nr:hypothetical protein [Paludibacteraceae bacterium]